MNTNTNSTTQNNSRIVPFPLKDNTATKKIFYRVVRPRSISTVCVEWDKVPYEVDGLNFIGKWLQSIAFDSSDSVLWSSPATPDKWQDMTADAKWLLGIA